MRWLATVSVTVVTLPMAVAGCGGEPPVSVETVVQSPAPAPAAAAPAPTAAPPSQPTPAPAAPAPAAVSPSPEPAPAAAASVPARSLQDLFDEVDGPDVRLIPGVSDLAVGDNHISFLVVRDDGSLVQAPQARVRVGRIDEVGDLADAATIDGTVLVDRVAQLEPVGPHTHPESEGAAPHDHEDTTDVYTTRLSFGEPGRYWVLVDPEGEEIQGYEVFEVRARPLAPAVGDEAYPSDNPTLDDAPAEQITTASPPDRELLRHSIQETLAAGRPFVVTFATPAFCVSRVCGPTVEVVDAVRDRLQDSPVRFIHVEIYEGNDPNKGFNRWVTEWQLPTEPWTFLVDDRGVIVERIEGAISVEGLDTLVRQKLLSD